MTTEINQKQANSSTDVLTVGTIHKLFAKLQARYGNQWTTQWNDDRIYKLAIDEWFNELQHLTVNDLRKGLDNYRGDFPPNLIQFYDACTQKPIGRPAPCYKPYHSEPDKRALEHNKGKADQESGNKHINKIKGIL